MTCIGTCVISVAVTVILKLGYLTARSMVCNMQALTFFIFYRGSEYARNRRAVQRCPRGTYNYVDGGKRYVLHAALADAAYTRRTYTQLHHKHTQTRTQVSPRP